jgi:hypothetical protein
LRQVDDLEEIGDLEGYIDRTSTILIYCSKGYFQSKNCVRELVATVNYQKPIIGLIDPEASHGGLSVDEVHAQLLQADLVAISKWSFRAQECSESSTSEWHGKFIWPGGEALSDMLLQHEAIEWNRECSHAAPRCCSIDRHVVYCPLQASASFKTSQCASLLIGCWAPPPAARTSTAS